MLRESKVALVDRTKRTIKTLRQCYPDADCTLNHSNPLELLVATILSAQCTDAHVNQITPALFAKYRSAYDYARVDLEALQSDIQTIGLFRNKSKFIKEASRALVEKHRGHVPQTMDELVALPGVARKTANVVLGAGFGIAEGIVVDTHVFRLSKRLGLVDPAEKNTDRVERALIRVVPKEERIFIGHALVTHGRQVCHALKPECTRCPLAKRCPKNDVKDAV